MLHGGKFCKDSYAVVHSAWHVVPCGYADAAENLKCPTVSLSLAQGALAAGVPKFVGIGRSAGYDLSIVPATIEKPLQPESLYPASKVAMFHVLSNLFRAGTIQFVWARVFYLYGEGEHPQRMFSYLRERFSKGLPAHVSDGTQIRDYLDVKVAAGEAAAMLEYPREGPVNVFPGQGISIWEFAEKLPQTTGRTGYCMPVLERETNLIRISQLGPEARCIVGFNPSVSNMLSP